MSEDSFVACSPESDFPLANLPFGVGIRPGEALRPCICVALGDQVVDLRALDDAGCFSGPILSQTDCFQQVRVA